MAAGVASETWDRGVELEFAGEDDRCRVRLAECGEVRFEDAVPARSFRWSREQGHFPGWWWLATTGKHRPGGDGRGVAAVLAALA